jgi:hypothetical protein
MRRKPIASGLVRKAREAKKLKSKISETLPFLKAYQPKRTEVTIKKW